MPQLEIYGAFGFARPAECNFIHLVMNRSSFLLQEQITSVVGELVAQEIFNLLRLLRLLFEIIELSKSHIGSTFGRKNLALNLLDLDVEDNHLLDPVLFAPIPPGLGETQ